MARSVRWFGFMCLFFIGSFLMFAGSSMQACSTPAPEPGKCKADTDCATEDTKKVCDKNAEKCVQCLKDDNCATGETCDQTNSVCTKGCKEDKDCKDKQTCDRGACVPKCDKSEDCKPTEKCVNLRCVDASCKEDKDCDSGETCKDSKCTKEGDKNRPGAYQNCPGPKGEECLDGLKCLTYKGGTANYCWKPCTSCEADKEVCVTEDKFAEGHTVCMKVITEESASYNYDQGTACSDKLVPLHPQNMPAFGTCWKTCTEKCLGDRKCLPHPNVEGDTKFCMKACKADSDCPSGSACKEHTKSNNEFYCF